MKLSSTKLWTWMTPQLIPGLIQQNQWVASGFKNNLLISLSPLTIYTLCIYLLHCNGVAKLFSHSAENYLDQPALNKCCQIYANSLFLTLLDICFTIASTKTLKCTLDSQSSRSTFHKTPKGVKNAKRGNRRQDRMNLIK